MKSSSKFFNNSKMLPVDKFFYNVLYDKKNGYYNTSQPLGERGDYITSPIISNLFSEMIAIWIISVWENLGKPKIFNIVELGPGDGSLTKTLLDVLKRFPQINAAKNIYLFEISKKLKKIQKKKINNNEIRWIKNFSQIKSGPVIFFGNEFFDAIPIKQFKRRDKILLEKHYTIKNNSIIRETFKKASKQDEKKINSFRSLKNQKFVEYPKYGLNKLRNIIKQISKNKGGILIIDYGYLKPNNQNTIQSVLNHKKNHVFSNLGNADITAHVNFGLLSEFFLKHNLKTEKTITQKEFLNNMGISKRAEIIAKKMKFREQSNLFLRLKRLISPAYMGKLFKVIFAHNFKNKNFYGFN